MKTLFIVRHAKSSWDNPMLTDHDRPLLEIGKKRTQLVVSKLQELRVKPDVIMSSSAMRAIETARYLAKGLDFSVQEIKASNTLYMASTRDLLQEFSSLSNRYQSVILVGHNPTLTNLANVFLSQPLENLPTSAVVHLCFDTDKWNQIHQSELTLEKVYTPKKLKNRH